jgi:hypothetical protein
MLGIDDLSRLPPPRPYSHQAPLLSPVFRLLNRRCGPISDATIAQIQRPYQWISWKPWP